MNKKMTAQRIKVKDKNALIDLQDLIHEEPFECIHSTALSSTFVVDINYKGKCLQETCKYDEILIIEVDNRIYIMIGGKSYPVDVINVDKTHIVILINSVIHPNVSTLINIEIEEIFSKVEVEPEVPLPRYDLYINDILENGDYFVELNSYKDSCEVPLRAHESDIITVYEDTYVILFGSLVLLENVELSEDKIVTYTVLDNRTVSVPVDNIQTHQYVDLLKKFNSHYLLNRDN